MTKIDQETRDLGDYFKGKLSAADEPCEPSKPTRKRRPFHGLTRIFSGRGMTLAIEAQNVINARSERFDLMVKRVAAIPGDYRTVPGVVAPLQQFNDAAAILKANIASMKANQAQMLTYLGQAFAKPIAR